MYIGSETLKTLDIDQFDPAEPALKVDPYPIYRRYREKDPVHWGRSSLAGYAGAWYIFGHDDTISVLKDPRFGKARRSVAFDSDQSESSQAPPVPDAARTFFTTARQWLVHRDPPDHTRLRAVLKHQFTPAAVGRMRPRIAQIAHELLDGLAEQGGAELISEFAFPLPVYVIAEMLGLPEDGRSLLVECSWHWQAVDVLTTDEAWRRAGDAIDKARDYLADLVARRRKSPRDDLIGVLIEGHRVGQVSADELLANIMFLFVAGAGFQTTTGLIGSGIHLLLTYPDQRAKLERDWGLIPSAVDEVLRYEPAIQTTNRNVREDVELGGKTIRAGDSALVVFASANRDPRVFDDPDRFDITCPRNQHHSFGLGIHYCLGGPLATVETEIAIQAIFQRFRSLQPAGPAVWNPLMALRVLRTLPATW